MKFRQKIKITGQLNLTKRANQSENILKAFTTSRSPVNHHRNRKRIISIYEPNDDRSDHQRRNPLS